MSVVNYSNVNILFEKLFYLYIYMKTYDSHS